MTTKLATLAVAAVLMWGLKRYYADAPVDHLRWILAPTARVVTLATGVSFEHEAGEGYVSRERRFAIEKACAGINFFIAAFGMIAWMLAGRAGSHASAAAVLAVAIVAGYIAAVFVNAFRITIALWLGGHPLRAAWLTAAQMHRVEGVVCYFAGLLVLYEIVRRCSDGSTPNLGRAA